MKGVREDMNYSEFYASLSGKRVAVCGIGRNNTPVVLQLLAHGANVTACDKRSREELGDTATILEQAGATLQLGDSYLDHLDADLILRTPGMKPYLPSFCVARNEGKTVTSEMELFFDLCPAPIYAVTGSDGKTTTTTVISEFLKAAGYRVYVGGNIGHPLLCEAGEMKEDDIVVLTESTETPNEAKEAMTDEEVEKFLSPSFRLDDLAPEQN